MPNKLSKQYKTPAVQNVEVQEIPEVPPLIELIHLSAHRISHLFTYLLRCELFRSGQLSQYNMSLTGQSNALLLKTPLIAEVVGYV